VASPIHGFWISAISAEMTGYVDTYAPEGDGWDEGNYLMDAVKALKLRRSGINGEDSTDATCWSINPTYR
jgi:hypothetical protein